MNASAAPEAGATRLVWDLPVRIMHWGLALAVLGSFLSQKLEGDYFRYHVWCGYAVLALAATRVLWGFVGTRHARFASFVRGPRAIARHVRALLGGSAEAACTGHNPLGALMVVALLALLLVQALTGLFANDQIMNVGPLFGYVSAATSERLTSVHARLEGWILGVIVLHVIAVFAYLLVRRENLLAAMVTGRKAAALVPEREAIDGSRLWLAALLFATVCTAIAVAVRTAPEGSLSFF